MTTNNDGLKPRSVCCIGLGLMGEPMTRHLVGAGWAVTGYDIDAARRILCAQFGVEPASRPAEAARDAEFVILNLPNGHATQEAMWGVGGLASVLRPPQLVVDFSTIGPAMTVEFAARLARETTCRWIDAPVSGGPQGAESGTLTAMLGGEVDDIERAAPLLDSVTSNRTRLGPCGSGQTMKLIKQLSVGTNHLVLAEAARLAEALGVDVAAVPGCLSGGHADSVLLKTLYPRMVDRDFEPVRGYALQLLKDLALVTAAAEASGLALPLTRAARHAYESFVAGGDGRRDTAAIIDLLVPQTRDMASSAPASPEPARRQGDR